MEKNREKYILGEWYYAMNPYLHNRQSGGELIGWTLDGRAILLSPRWGEFCATVEDLDKHN